MFLRTTCRGTTVSFLRRDLRHFIYQRDSPRVVVQTKDKRTIRGTLHLVLADALILLVAEEWAVTARSGDGQGTWLATGGVAVPRENVSYLQLLTPTGEEERWVY